MRLILTCPKAKHDWYRHSRFQIMHSLTEARNKATREPVPELEISHAYTLAKLDRIEAFALLYLSIWKIGPHCNPNYKEWINP